MDKHTVFSFLVAFWPLWVALAVTFVVSLFEGDTTTYWYGDQQISKAEYESMKDEWDG